MHRQVGWETDVKTKIWPDRVTDLWPLLMPRSFPVSPKDTEVWVVSFDSGCSFLNTCLPPFRHTCSHQCFFLTKGDEEIWFTLNYASIWMPEAFHRHLSGRFTFFFFTRKPLAFRDVNVTFCQFNLDEGRRTFSISEFAAVFCPLLTFMETEHVFIGINRGTFTCRRDAALLNLWMKSGDTPPEMSLPMA